MELQDELLRKFTSQNEPVACVTSLGLIESYPLQRITALYYDY